MSATQEVAVDILPPLPHNASAPRTVPRPFASDENEALRTFYHPASGVIILGLDWLAFGTDLLTGLLAVPIVCVLSFIVSFTIIFAIQRRLAKNSFSGAMSKAFMGSFLVAVPFPITGTVLGAAILVLSGLPHHPVEIVKKLAERGKVK